MIAVIAGGSSSERQVSLWTAKTVTESLTRLGLDYSQIDCSDEEWINQLKQLSPKVAILALHGRYGEDGTVQTVLDGLNIPYTGSSASVAATAFDKNQAKLKAVAMGLSTPRTVVLNQMAELDPEQIKLPAVVKPNQEGSSFGITLVWSRRQLEPAVNVAFEYCSTVLIEEYIPGTELTCAVIDVLDSPQALPLVEIRPHTEFFDFKAKYDASSCEEICPAPVSKDLTEQIQKQTLEIYQALGCRQYARVDWIERSGTPYFLEINTLPGMTPTSLINKELQAAGISFDRFVEALIATAPEIRHNESRKG